MKKIIVLLSALLIMSTAAFSVPGGAPPRGESGMDAMGGSNVFRFVDELGLSDRQVEKLQAMKDASKRDIAELLHKIKMASWDIKDELKKKSPDKAKIDAAIEKVSGYQKELMKIRTGHMLKTKEILTDKQFKMLLTMMEHKKDKKKKWFSKNSGKDGRNWFKK